VTGASTGIGRKITEVLAARGVYVYAGARKEKDLSELDAIDNV
jgi:NADP-dependent 3-hydroxy acid dehydrogenase YdfG